MISKFKVQYKPITIAVSPMLTKDLINSLQNLTRADKLQAMQVLVSTLAQEESNLLKPGLTYEVSSPYDSFEAAKKMLEVLEQSKNQ
jgi:hypothetical protein